MSNASGTLGVMACPILEDELLYSLSKDKETKKIFLLDNKHAKSIKQKLALFNITYTLIPEDDFFTSFTKPANEYSVVIWMMDLGLHEEPTDLRSAIETLAKKFEDKIDALAMYYGLCGNGMKDVDVWCKKNLKVPMTIFRDANGNMVDDCISVAIGGQKKYYELLKKYPGIMYFTPAFATNYDDLLGRMELFKGVDTGDDSMLKMVFEMADYHYVMKIPTGLGDQTEFHTATVKFADRMGFEIMTLEDGWCTLEPADRIYAEAKAFLQ